jgi:hypothetical protein
VGYRENPDEQPANQAAESIFFGGTGEGSLPQKDVVGLESFGYSIRHESNKIND